jgi:hypothetical protein
VSCTGIISKGKTEHKYFNFPPQSGQYNGFTGSAVISGVRISN